MNRYPEYKESGIEWVEEIPGGWKVVPLKHAASVNRAALSNNTDPDFRLRYIDIGNVDSSGNVAPPQEYRFEDAPSRARRIIARNDTIVSTVRTYLKAVAFIDADDSDLIASTGFATLTPGAEVVPKYLYYLMTSQGVVDAVSARSVGVSYPAINSSDLAGIPIPLPPLDEQRQLAAYLDRKTGEIDTLIRKKQALIALLREQRTALIHRAVTKGLDPDVPMKDSGVEWLGEVPEHWATVQVRYAAKNCDNRRIPLSGQERSDRSGPYPYYGANGIIDYIDDYIFDGTYVLIGEDGAPFFDPLQDVARVATGQYWVNNHAHILKPRETFDPYYLMHALNRVDYAGYISGSTRDKLTQSDLSSIKVPRPPRQEQEEIAGYLARKTSEINTIIERERGLIDLLRELRTSLISEVVTGKIDVRGEVSASGGAPVAAPTEEVAA